MSLKDLKLWMCNIRTKPVSQVDGWTDVVGSHMITVHCGLILVACWCREPLGWRWVDYVKQRLLNYQDYQVS